MPLAISNALPPSLLPVTLGDWYDANIAMTQRDIEAARKCEQKSKEWLKIRSYRITGSRFAVALGHSYPYDPENPDSKPITFWDALNEFVWPAIVEGPAVTWGNLNEDNARMVSEVVVRRYLRKEFGTAAIKSIRFSYPGTIICTKAHWVCVSPDGLVRVEFTDPSKKPEDILLEFKCPYTKKNFYGDCGGGIPLYYFDQIQGSMGFLRMCGYNMHRCYFSVWTREKTQVSQYKYEKEYFEDEIYPRSEAFYFDQLLPRFMLKALNILRKGELQLIPMSSQAVQQSQSTQGGTSASRGNPYKRPAAPCDPFYFPESKK